MDHTYFNQLLAVYALGACEPAEIAPIEVHLSQCAPCSAEVQQLSELTGWLTVPPVSLPPASLRTRVLREAGYRAEQ
jgi:anti-sigma factor ChrR (cupin superfamily)